MLMVDEDFEHLFREWELTGHDPARMRETHEAIAAMEVGESTPAPGTLLREPTLIMPPPVHHWWTDPPESKLLLSRSALPEKHITLRGLNREVHSLRRVIVAILLMFIATQTVIVLAVKT